MMSERSRNDPGGLAMTPAAERKRRERQRRQAGIAILPIPVCLSDVADTLIETRRLPAWDAEDRDKIIEAVAKLIADLTKDHA